MRTNVSRIAVAPEAEEIPLVIDLDGTLTRSDLLVEAIFHLISQNPFILFGMLAALLNGKAAFKAFVADRALLDFEALPLNEELVSFLRMERARGRRIYLASASDRRFVEALADHVGLFDGVFGSDRMVNLAGPAKARVLRETFGSRGFDYAGNARVDLHVWAEARRAILVDVSPKLRLEAERRCPDLHDLSPPRTWSHLASGYLRAMRVHQWLKNLLLFLPALADHNLAPATLIQAGLAFLAFSLCASSVYLLNDLLDLPSDRVHPTKRRRPFACGRVPLIGGLILIPALLLAAAAISTLLPIAFAGVLACYYVVTLLYSLVLKRKMVIDVMTLAGLYTIRVLAGAAATGIAVSEWLLAFSMFLFLCLALVKRYSELVERVKAQKGKPVGRGYLMDDTPMVGALAGASGFVSVLVLALYINSPDVLVLYSRPEALWALSVLLLYWISRVLMLAHRGEVHDDPVIFAMKDRLSLVTVALSGLAVLAGSFL